MHAQAHSGPWLANYSHLRLSARNCARTKLRGEFRVHSSEFVMFILLISKHTVFLVQFGINLHLWVFQKAEIALAEAARAISTFWKTRLCKLIPNWTRKTVWLPILSKLFQMVTARYKKLRWPVAVLYRDMSSLFALRVERPLIVSLLMNLELWEIK